LRGFRRGASSLFSLPRLEAVFAADLMVLGAWIFSAWPLQRLSACYIIYILCILPLAFLAVGRPIATAKRAFGLTPIFLAYGFVADLAQGLSALACVPPTLTLIIPIRFILESPARVAPLAVLPLILGAALNPRWDALLQAAAVMLLGLASVEAIRHFARVRLTRAAKPGYQLLRRALLYLLTGDAAAFEESLNAISVTRRVPVYVVDLMDSDQRVQGMIVVSYVHPGPYRNLGSSALPTALLLEASRRGVTACFLHGTSQHSEDLALSSEGMRLISAILGGEGEVLGSGAEIGLHTSTLDDFRATAISLQGITICILEREMGVMEDLPLSFHDSLSWKSIIPVDAHNSISPSLEGGTFSPETGEGRRLLGLMLEAGMKAREKLASGWTVSLSSMRGASDLDVAEGGFTLVAFKRPASGEGLALVSVDGNNMLRHTRRLLLEMARPVFGGEVLFTTTDTHVYTGIKPRESYRPVGAGTSAAELRDRVTRLFAAAREAPLAYRVRRIIFESRFLDPSCLNALSSAAEGVHWYALALMLVLLSSFLSVFIL